MTRSCKTPDAGGRTFGHAVGPLPQREASVKKLTPIMCVEAIEPCLQFWTDLGFEITGTVPGDDGIGFAMLQKNGVEIMYQTRASVAADLPGITEELMAGATTLFIEVESLDEVLPALEGADVVMERRQTFYGMDEIFVRAPCGTIVGFAARLADAGEDG